MTELTIENPEVLFAIFEKMREGLVVTDADIESPGPRIVYANPAFSQITGWAQKDVIGRSPRFLQGPASDRGVLDRLRAALAEGRAFEGETINYRKDGRPFVMSWYIEPLVGKDGAARHFLAIQRDVTREREKAREQRTVEQAVRQLVDFAVLFGADGAVTYANHSYRRWSRRDPEQLLGTPVWQIDGAPRGNDLRWARRVLGRGAPWRRRYTALRHGEERSLFVTVSPILDVGGGQEFIAVARDVTGIEPRADDFPET